MADLKVYRFRNITAPVEIEYFNGYYKAIVLISEIKNNGHAYEKLKKFSRENVEKYGGIFEGKAINKDFVRKDISVKVDALLNKLRQDRLIF